MVDLAAFHAQVVAAILHGELLGHAADLVGDHGKAALLLIFDADHGVEALVVVAAVAAWRVVINKVGGGRLALLQEFLLAGSLLLGDFVDHLLDVRHRLNVNRLIIVVIIVLLLVLGGRLHVLIRLHIEKTVLLSFLNDGRLLVHDLEHLLVLLIFYQLVALLERCWNLIVVVELHLLKDDVALLIDNVAMLVHEVPAAIHFASTLVN